MNAINVGQIRNVLSQVSSGDLHLNNHHDICHVVTLRFIHFSYVNIEFQPGALIKVIVQVPKAELP